MSDGQASNPDKVIKDVVRTGPATSLWKDGVYVRFWIARTASWAGTGISTVVLPLFVYQRSNSPLLTSLLSAMAALPYLAFGLLAGATADRIKSQSLMVVCDLACCVLMASIPVAAAFRVLTVSQVLLIAFACGTLFVWFDAASFSAVATMAGQQRIVPAVSALSSSSAVTSAVAPAIAGGLLAVVAPAYAVIADAASYLISAALIFSIKWPFTGPKNKNDPVKPADGRLSHNYILGGLRFLWRNQSLRSMTMISAMVSVSGGAVMGQLVVYATRALNIKNNSNAQIGFLFAAAATGAAISGVILPKLRKHMTAQRLAAISVAAGMGTLVLVAGAPGFVVALAMLACFNFAYSLVTINTISFRQQVTPANLQGRVNTAGRMLGWGGYPAGALIGGALATVLPIRIVYLLLIVPIVMALVISAWQAFGVNVTGEGA
jgi:MFS family permease